MPTEVKRSSTKSYDQRMKQLKKHINIADNRNLIIDFMRDCELGKTVKNRAKKTIGKYRLSSYLSFLKKLNDYWKKPFNKVTLEDMEQFIEELQQDKVLNRWKKPYTSESKLGAKITIRKFFRWLYKDDPQHFDKLTGWIETYVIRTEITALSKEQIKKVVENAPNLRLKVFFQTLFDSGCRKTEYLNLKWSDFTFSEKVQCYKVRIRGETSKTFGRTITLPLSTTYIKEWERANPNRNPDDFFMPIEHRNAGALVNRWTEKTLGRKLGCHVFGRHSSATYYASKLMPYVFCKRFGWVMGSNMAQRYIDREGVDIEEATEEVQADIIKSYEDKIDKMKEEQALQKMAMEDMQNKQEHINKVLEALALEKKIKNMGK